jgi:hypothetical protein
VTLENFPPIHLSVNANGIASLWDTAEQAQQVRDEVYVRLELTNAQVQQLYRAKEQAAKQGETNGV